MFYRIRRRAGGSETVDSNMSKAEILRGIVTEKLTTAAQEILAVVERTVAGYEEEASGFRREIDRQRRQLEVLLQPRVKLERKAPVPDYEGQEVVGLSEAEETEEEQQQQQQQQQQSGVGDTGSLGLLWYDGNEEGDEEQHLLEQQTINCKQRREDLKDPDFQIKSRLSSPSVRRGPGRPRLGDLQNHLDLRICILEDSQTDILSKSVFKKCPMQELQCPLGLQEADFVDLLRSSFPQLAAQKSFEVFTSDRSRRLHPLRVKALTAEEIHRRIRLTGAGHSALYIRLKSEGDAQNSSEDPRPPQRRDDSPSGSATTSADQRYSSVRRKRGRPRCGEGPSHYFLKVCMLDDSQSDVLSRDVLLKSSVQELRCPRGLQQADFLNLLRSTFPQLAGDDKPFHIFKSDRSGKLQRLKVESLTPEKIYRSIKSTGVEKALIYLRLKTGEEEEEEEEELLPKMDEVTPDSLIRSDEATFSSRVDVLSSSLTSNQQHMETEEAGVEDEDAADSSDYEGKDGGEAFDEDVDWNPDPELQSSKLRRKREGRASVVPGRLMGSKKHCKVCGVWYKILGSLIKHAWSHVEEPQRVCGVCGEHFGSVEELKEHLRSYQKTHDCLYCGKSFMTLAGLSSHTTLHTGDRPFKCDVCTKTFARMSSLSVHRWVHVAEKPHKCDFCPKTFGLMAQLTAHRKTHVSKDRYHCNVCGKTLCDLRSFTRHKVTHSGERRYGCEVCGKRFKLSSTLKAHEKIHTVRERPYLCDICCKTFHSSYSLTHHIKTHSDERPFVCVECGKRFLSNGMLKAHMCVHTSEAPYGCLQCGRHFKRKTHLNNHVRSHLGIKLFVCAICGKACSRQEHLTVHMRTHNGERPYQCTVCDKAFTQSHCLKTHMKSHQGEENTLLNASSS